LSKHTDITIPWKAIEEHFLMDHFSIQPFVGQNAIFLIFSQKTSVLSVKLGNNKLVFLITVNREIFAPLKVCEITCLLQKFNG
jgi:3-hydroxymyristoyl/3-hydroxydecanoyl-(acyl carrier protein) dehydratase